MNVKTGVQTTPEATPLEGGTARTNSVVSYLDGLKYCELAGIQNVLPIDEVRKRAASQPFSGAYANDSGETGDAANVEEEYEADHNSNNRQSSSEE
jgi:hypothetical protein